MTTLSSLPPPPPLPYAQIAVMIFSWLSFIIYVNLLFIILTQKNKRTAILKSSVYYILLFNSIGDICMFFHSEVIMRPRKYRFFYLFDDQCPLWFAYLSYFMMTVYRLVMIMGYVILAANRLTAFWMPLKYQKMWKPKYIAYITVGIWNIALVLVAVMFAFEPNSLKFVMLPNGILQLLGGDLFVWDAIEVAVVSLISCLACAVFYIGGAIYVTKTAKNTSVVERKLFICCILASTPLLVESCKAWYLLYGTLRNDTDTIIFVADMWFYWTEIMTSVQCWSILLITPSARRLLLEEGFMGLFCRSKKYKVTVLYSSTQSQHA